MAKANVKVRLEKLLDNEFSISSNDKIQFLSGYGSLMEILRMPQSSKQLHGCHDLLFECISQIILTPFNHCFDDEQLRVLLDLVSNACVLTMSQNQIIDGWLQNIEERTFEKPHSYGEEGGDDDDDEWLEDTTDSDEDEEVTVKVVGYASNASRGREGNRPRQQHVSFDPSSVQQSSASVVPKEKPSMPTQPRSNRGRGNGVHAHEQRGGHHYFDRNELAHRSARGKPNQRGRNDLDASHSRQGFETARGKGRRAPEFDNKYGVDLRLYDCYICGEYGHVQYDCPRKSTGVKPIGRGTARGAFRNRRERNRSRSPSLSSSSSSAETNGNETEHNRVQHLCNLASKLLNSSQSVDERTETFDSFVSSIERLQNQHGAKLAKVLQDKEATFYSLLCHIAQNEFLFSEEQYLKFYELRNVLCPSKVDSLNNDRPIFCRQRQLLPLATIEKHFGQVTSVQQSIFNDFQEYILRSTAPISRTLYNLIRDLLKSAIHVEKQCLDHFTKKLLFDVKKDLFSPEQFDELQSCLAIRTKRSERNNQKQVWKERLNLFRNDQLPADVDPWLADFEQILKLDSIDVNPSATVIVDHAMWYFAVLLMASSGHLNAAQYAHLLGAASQSALFNAKQKFYFQHYRECGQAPIVITELKEAKMKLDSENGEEKMAAYAHILKILERSKPEFAAEEVSEAPPPPPPTTSQEQTNKPDDTIPLIDNHVLLRLICLTETICSDTQSFSVEQCTALLDKFLQASTIVRPLSNAEQQRLKACYSRPVSLSELQRLCSSSQFDADDLVTILRHRSVLNNDETYEYLAQQIVHIFENRRRFATERCDELRSLVEKRTFGKLRYRRIADAYQKFRVNIKSLPLIDPAVLTQLLTKILAQDHQAHSEFFTLLEQFSQRTDFDGATVEFEVNRCLFATIILLISETDFTNATNPGFFRQRLRTIVDKQAEFFAFLLTEQQFKLVRSRLSPPTGLDALIDSMETAPSEAAFASLMRFVDNDLQEKNDVDKLFNFVLRTFDNQCLSVEQTLRVSEALVPRAKTLKSLCEFLIDLLRLGIHRSPKVLLEAMDNGATNDQTVQQVMQMLKAPNGKHAVADWKKGLLRLLPILVERTHDGEQLKDLAERSPMFQVPIFRQQLEACWSERTDENRQPSVALKTTEKPDQSAAHREMFRQLESDEASVNASIVYQLHGYLTDQQLSHEISLAKFIQALQTIFKNPRKFTQVPLDKWVTLIANNRGKIFDDAQCDQLLFNIVLARFNLPVDTLRTLSTLIQSKKAHERHDGLQKLLTILQGTQMNAEKKPAHNLSTIAAQVYDLVTRVVFDEKFSNSQVRQCLAAAGKSFLLNGEHRQKLNEIQQR